MRALLFPRHLCRGSESFEVFSLVSVAVCGRKLNMEHRSGRGLGLCVAVLLQSAADVASVLADAAGVVVVEGDHLPQPREDATHVDGAATRGAPVTAASSPDVGGKLVFGGSIRFVLAVTLTIAPSSPLS